MLCRRSLVATATAAAVHSPGWRKRVALAAATTTNIIQQQTERQPYVTTTYHHKNHTLFTSAQSHNNNNNNNNNKTQSTNSLLLLLYSKHIHPEWSIVSAAKSFVGNTTTTIVTRSYISRAHPKPRPVWAIGTALREMRKEADQRRERRKLRNEKHKRQLGHPDETVEIVFQLNLDPRKPGQALRGTITLPHGTGKKLDCIVFTRDEQVAARALEMGAKHAGGTDLIDSIVRSGTVDVTKLSRGLATKDIMDDLSKQAARILGPRGLMPNVKNNSVYDNPQDLIDALATQIMGKQVQYRTETEGLVYLPVGKVSFDVKQLLENIGTVVKEIYAVKPEQYGKGKKAGKASAGPTKRGVKYVMQVYVSSTQGKGYKIDLKTLDPNSLFFLSDPLPPQEEEEKDDRSSGNVVLPTNNGEVPVVKNMTEGITMP